ncbi:MAG TPA: molybdenum cofactor biosynthesis protein MoaE [Terriglobales bacterium]|nr:molybdenum cofactor biosynthesis protein MoaE [Terriglobales bacterium]
MQVRVLFFGILKDLTGTAQDWLEVPERASIRDVVQVYVDRIPDLRRFMNSVAVSLNQDYASQDAILNPGDEIGFLPPVSGGAPRAYIVREKIVPQDWLNAVKRGEDGAAVLFDGVVRNNTRGRRTLYLDYEAYEEMALRQMESLVEKAIAQFAVRDVVMVHRLGRLEIGETSVLIVVASAHRGPAFDACHWIIDTLKKTVPIWKKEYFEDGAVWADGEPFPAEIAKLEGSYKERPASK